MEIRLSRAVEEDSGFLAELFNDVRGPEFQLAGLPPEMLEQLLSMQRRAQALSYATQYPEAVDEIVWVAGERAGRMLVSTGTKELCLVDIALLTRFRGQGVGTQLLKTLCNEARTAGKRLHLSVRGGNPAARLYERLGFVVVVGGDGVYSTMELAANPASGAAEEIAATDAEGGEVAQDYTRQYFTSLVGQRLRTRTLEYPGRPASSPVELVVDAVELLKSSAFADRSRGAEVEVGDSFVVRLHGREQELLPPETVEIQPETGEAMAAFLTPLGPKDGAMQYEIVFNRMQPQS